MVFKTEHSLTESELINKIRDTDGGENPVLKKQLLDECITQFPSNAEALRELGLFTYGMLKNSIEARALVERSLEIEDSAMSHFYLGLILCDLDLISLGDNEFLCSLEQSDNDPMICAMYADVLAGQGEIKKAQEYLAVALSKEPEYELALEIDRKVREYLEQTLGPKTGDDGGRHD